MNIIVFTSQFYQPGGAETLQVELATELSMRNDVTVRMLHMGFEEDSRLAAITATLREKGITVDALGIGYNPSIWKLRAYIRQVRDYLYAHKADVVETGHVTLSILAAHAVQNSKTILVEGIHAPFTSDVCLGRFSAFRRWFWCSSVRKQAKFYAISAYVADCWASYASVPRSSIKVIYNSAGPQFFNAKPERKEVAQEIGINPDCRWILFAGRIRKDKGVLTLLNAMRYLADASVELLFAGGIEPGNEPIADEIERVNQQGPMAGHVHYLGYRRDLPRLMASSDLFVLPTQREGFGMVLVESLAAGTPVVATSVGAIPEILEGSGASLVPPNNEQALAAAIRENLSLDASSRQILIYRGRQHANRFTSAKRTQDLLNLFYSCRNQG